MNEPTFLSVDPKLLKSEERIIVAAIRVFADNSLEKASLRTIAKEAEISLSAVTYYFKTKENLYREVFKRILSYVSSSIPQLEEKLPEKMSKDAAKAELRKTITAMTERIYGNSGAALISRIHLREQLSPSPIYDVLFREYYGKIINRLTGLVRILCKKMPPRRATIQAFSILGQMIAFRIEREMIVRQLQFTGYSPEEVKELQDVLMENIFRQLGVEQ